MSSKKKPPVSAFYFFMVERKLHYEKNGECFPNGPKDVMEKVGPEWQEMSRTARKKYEDIAKEEKARQKADTSKKFTNQRNSFDDMEKRKMEIEKAKEMMNKQIESTIRSLSSSKKLAEFKFHLIHVNYFFNKENPEGDCYYPAELAVAECSLAEGVTDVYHTIVDAGEIPLGYRYDAVQRSAEVHHIPLEPKGGERRYYEVWRRVKAVLEGGRGGGDVYPPLYTMADNVALNTSISCVRSVVRTLCEAADDDLNLFPVYRLDKLLFELKNACANLSGTGDTNIHWPNVSFASSKLETDVYNFASNIACGFHCNEDHVVNCSKSFVQRWAYLICDECCQFLKIPLIRGKHVPVNAAVGEDRSERENEKREVVKLAPEPHYLLNSDTRFSPVEVKHPPILQQRVTAVTKPMPKLIQMPSNNETADKYFSWAPGRILVSRGRGKIAPWTLALGRGSAR